MSLQYIIDGYNIINHHHFKLIRIDRQDPRLRLLEAIRINRLSGSLKNKVIVVFDGYPPAGGLQHHYDNIEAVFSRKESADARIKDIVESCGNPRNIVVVSDDKDIVFFVKAAGAYVLSAEEFLNSGPGTSDSAGSKKKKNASQEDSVKPELTYSQRVSINKELARIWLKK